MKTKIYLLILLLAILSVSAHAQQTMYICQGNNYTAVTIASVGDMPFSSNGAVITINGVNYNISDIDSLTFTQPSFATTGKVVITYSGSTANVSVPSSVTGVTYSVSGANVTLNSTTTTEEIEYVLQGTSSDGSLTFNGAYKCTIDLNGLSLTSTTGAAIDIECGKRITLVIEDGTVNTLTDASNGSQKACLYCKGHIEAEGGGTLNLVGNTKHAISTNEYLQLKKSTGTINITSAVSDGIHAGQYFQMNGGALNISGTAGDCVQAETTSDNMDEDNGQMIIKGGTMNLTVASSDVKGFKADSTITVTGGNMTIKVTGSGSKGISTDGNVVINENDNTTTINIIAAGGTFTDDSGDVKYCMGMNIGGNLTISAGTITVTNTGDESRSIKVDGTYYANGGTVTANISASSSSGVKSANFNMQEGAVLNVNCTGTDSKGLSIDSIGTINGGTIDMTISSSSSKGIRASQDLLINGGTFTFDISGDASKAISAESFDIEGGTFTVKTSGSPIVTDYNPSYCTAFKANSYTQNGGNINITCIGIANKGISIDGNGIMNNGTVVINTSGNGGYYKASASTYDTYASCCMSGDGNMNFIGGTYTLKSTGTGGKNIKCDGILTIGATSSTTGPTISATTSGQQYSYSNNYTSSSKAIKSQGAIVINSGVVTVSTSTNEAEGIESKTSITINGGDIIANTYDDAINSSGIITFNGGRTYAYASNNDAIDSNYGRSGAITINGGIVIASGTSSPEEGLDCDNNSYIVIKGGTLFSMGGNQGGGTSSQPSCSQGTVFMQSLSLTSGQYLTVASSTGTNIYTIKIPRTNSQSYGFITNGDMTNETYTLTTGNTEPTSYSSAWQGLYIDANITTGTTLGSSTVSNNYGTVGSASSGGETNPGGGGTPPGGRP